MQALDMALAQLPERRRQQERFAQAVADAMAQGKNLVSELPVGTGKSFGYLLPLALSGKRALVATYSLTLQEQLRTGDLPWVRKAANAQGIAFKWAILKGASNYACHKLADRYATDEDLRAWVFSEQPHGHDLALVPPGVPRHEVEEIRTDMDECDGKACPWFTECAVRAAKRAAKEANLVVTNQALLMAAAANPAVLDLEDFSAIVLDEAHQLPDVARGAFGSSLSRFGLNKAFRHIAKSAEHPGLAEELLAKAREVWSEIAAASAGSRAEKGRVEKGDRWAVPPAVLADRLAALDEIAQRASEGIAETGEIWIQHDQPRVKAARYLDGLRATLGDMKRAASLGVLVWEVGENKVQGMEAWGVPGTLELCPVDVAPILRKTFWSRSAPKGCGLCQGEREILDDGDWKVCPRCDGKGEVVSSTPTSFILTSATLAIGASDGVSFGPFVDGIGLPYDGCKFMAASSPFDFARQAVLYVWGGDMANKRGADSVAWLAEIDYLVNVNKGRALVLFSSRKAMKDAYQRRGHRFPSLMQEPHVDRMQMIEWIRSTQGAVLYGTKTFWEGISIEGDALGLVIVDKVPFPVPTDPVYAARASRLGRAAFSELAVPKAATDLKQAAGRLIRTKHDRGLVAILDQRVRTNHGLAEAVMPHLMPGAPVFTGAEREAMIQAWATTGADIDLKASGYHIRPKAPDAQRRPSPAPPSQAAPANPSLRACSPAAPSDHPVLHLLPSLTGHPVHGRTLREVAHQIKPLLDLF